MAEREKVAFYLSRLQIIAESLRDTPIPAAANSAVPVDANLTLDLKETPLILTSVHYEGRLVFQFKPQGRNQEKIVNLTDLEITAGLHKLQQHREIMSARYVRPNEIEAFNLHQFEAAAELMDILALRNEAIDIDDHFIAALQQGIVDEEALARYLGEDFSAPTQEFPNPAAA